MRLRRSQVDDQLDGIICEQLVEVRVDAAAELGDKALGRPRVDVGRSDELEPVDGTDPVGIARRDVAAADDPDPHPSHPSSCSRIARHSSLGSWSVRLMLHRVRAAVADAVERAHAGLDVDDAAAPCGRVVRLANREHILQVDVQDVRRELLDGAGRVVALCGPPAGVDGRAHRPVACLDLLQHLARRALGVVLDREPDTVLAQHRHQHRCVARHAAADHVDAEPAGELARARHVRRADPRRVGRDGEPVTLEQRHGDPEVVIARPFGRQMGAPEIDGVEPERADPAEQLVEALLVGLQRREVVVRRPVALRPAVQVPAGLACHVVGGHERDHGAQHRTVSAP